MRRGQITVGALLLAVLTVVPAHAELYDVRVTRIARDAYLDPASRVVIITRYCYEYVYSQRAVLRYDGRGSLNNRLIFDSALSSTSCDVAGIYTPNATLSRVGRDLYRDLNSDTYLETSLCLSLALAEDALVLRNRVIFIDSREECDLR
jgi:hypothetical protein